MNNHPIRVSVVVPATQQQAWDAFTTPAAITQWNFANDDWQCPVAEVDLRDGGRHRARMEAKDGSFGFDFEGTYAAVEAPRALTLVLDDGREARTTFKPVDGGTEVATEFAAEAQNDREMQRAGWQAILDNYARFVSGQTA